MADDDAERERQKILAEERARLKAIADEEAARVKRQRELDERARQRRREQ